jgi:hypothetical protein
MCILYRDYTYPGTDLKSSGTIWWTVQTFATSHDAKEFLVARIITESQREGVLRSEVESKMLYFSEAASTLPEIAEANDAFDREYNQAEYEHKIGTLIRNWRATARAENREEFDAWNEAVRTIRREDHYLLILIAAAESSGMPAGRPMKLLAIALIVACAIIAVAFLVVNR